MRLDTRNIKTIAKKEFMDNLRNKWIVMLTLIFIILTLVMSFVQGRGDFSGVEITVVGMMAISSMLVPIIAIVLGYNTITGEAETGSLLVLLSNPIRRIEVLIGKFIGLGTVLATSTLLGFGIAGAIILAQDTSNVTGYLIFMILSLLLGLIYLSLSICVSAIMKRTATALGAGIGLFFWGMIMGAILIGVFMATGGNMDSLTGSYPDWMWAATVVLSPADMFQTSVMMGFGMTSMNFGEFSVTLPGFINPATISVIYAAWILIPMAMGYYFFGKRDI